MSGRLEPEAFDWRDENEARHVAKHGVRFGMAIAVFLDDERLESLDERKDYGEPRWNVIGVVDGRYLTVTLTMRGTTAWVISARPARRKERRAYGFEP